MDVPVIIQLEMEEQFFRRTPPERRNGRDSKWFLPHDFLVLQSLRAPLVSSDKTMRYDPFPISGYHAHHGIRPFFWDSDHLYGR
uniref:Uncharacterized protein n=1 Tax=Physcomitrium patens TaxID=3218 RepID=A0A2K1JPU7_PHYPA|nr:hypothetical protein PHYPA_015951 [Physcomitrium patens]